MCLPLKCVHVKKGWPAGLLAELILGLLSHSATSFHKCGLLHTTFLFSVLFTEREASTQALDWHIQNHIERQVRELEQKSFCFRVNHRSPDLVHGNCLHSLLDHWWTRICFACCFPWPFPMDRVSLTPDSVPLSPASWIASLNLELLLVEGQSTE